MTTATQREAWDEFRYSGALNRSQMIVMRHLWDYPGLTRNELDHALGGGKPNANYSRRIRELIRAQVIAAGTPRKCSITGVKCATYWPTLQTPVRVGKVETAKSKAERYEKVLRRINMLARHGIPSEVTMRLDAIKNLASLELGDAL